MQPDAPEPLNAPKGNSSSSPKFLPRIGSPAYHILLGAVAIFILGPLGGISSAFMDFSIGFFVGGQVLAGILGSVVTLPYGPEGRHGANYMQTMAASVAGMCAMSALVQAMVWMGLPQPPAWQLVLYFMCIGMFGVGLGMLYTPILVDRLQLTYPSGLAVANILRAMTDRELLKKSVFKLFGSIVAAFGISLWVTLKMDAFAVQLGRMISNWPETARTQFTGFVSNLSISTMGGGMIVGARIALPALWVGLIGAKLTPYLLSIGWLDEGDHYRKIGFIISLGAIMGAALLDVGIILVQAVRRLRQTAVAPAKEDPDWKRVNVLRLVAWVVFWAIATIATGHYVLQQPVLFLSVAVGLCFIFVLVNGIALGISDFNPISSAFVMSVFVMAAIGLRDPVVGLFCAAILAIATSEGGDMQQDRSTGWRLKSNRTVQFRYQVIGIAMGAVLAVVLAKVFLRAYPPLQIDQLTRKNLPETKHWQSAFTYKMVGALRGIVQFKPRTMQALALGMGIGLVIEILRKLIRNAAGYKAFIQKGALGKTASFLLDAVILPSPYASAFGGFVELPTILWWATGGVVSSLFDTASKKFSRAEVSLEGELPADMSTMSLVGGGFIAGDALAALAFGAWGIYQAIGK